MDVISGIVTTTGVLAGIVFSVDEGGANVMDSATGYYCKLLMIDLKLLMIDKHVCFIVDFYFPLTAEAMCDILCAYHVYAIYILCMYIY